MLWLGESSRPLGEFFAPIWADARFLLIFHLAEQKNGGTIQLVVVKSGRKWPTDDRIYELPRQVYSLFGSWEERIRQESG
jgi:hypothetical protein